MKRGIWNERAFSLLASPSRRLISRFRQLVGYRLLSFLLGGGNDGKRLFFFVDVCFTAKFGVFSVLFLLFCSLSFPVDTASFLHATHRNGTISGCSDSHHSLSTGKKENTKERSPAKQTKNCLAPSFSYLVVPLPPFVLLVCFVHLHVCVLSSCSCGFSFPLLCLLPPRL